MRVLADQIASSALSSDQNQRSTPKTETMATNPHIVTDAMWHRSALDTKEFDSALPSRDTQSGDMRSTRQVTLDEVMLHTNRVLHNADGFERTDYVKETITEEGGTGATRRDSLGSPADGENFLEAVMMHQNRILHNEDGYAREDYVKEKSEAMRDLLVDSEGSSIFS